MTDETKHTPGPWRIAQLNLEGLHSNDGSTSILAGDNGICSVSTMSPFKRGEGNRHVCAGRDANAALISAAPDMLKALHKIDRHLSILLGNIHGSEKVDPRWEGMKEIVNGWRADISVVIEKAEGRFK